MKTIIMKKPVVKVDVVETSADNLKSGSRRRFLKLGGLAFAGSSLLMYSCSDDDDFNQPVPPEGETFDLGAGDVGILNYAYALEQLEADFYTKVLAGGYYAGAEANEKQIMEDLYNHEVIHRDFFKAAISGAVDADQVLPELEFDFSSVDFNSRASVLGTAKVLEDTGVGAYNGAGNRLETELYLLLAGKIVSVEARHASAIRSLLNPNSADFAGDDVIDENGLDLAYTPTEVFAGAGPFITTEFTANNLPEPITS